MAKRTHQDRLFFAIDPGQKTKAQLLRLQSQLAVLDGRAVAGANFHVTLLFIGEVAPQITATLIECPLKFSQRPFELELGEALFWPKTGIVALDARPYEALFSLHKSIRQQVASILNLRRERRFTPHLTLYRNASFLASDSAAIELKERVEQVHLMRSHFTGDGVHYQILQSWSLPLPSIKERMLGSPNKN